MPLLSARLSDITTLAVDAIVNAANEELLPGAGVCGAIHAAAGPELAELCEEIGWCPTGEAVITPGFDLPAKYVIHAVGPVWYDEERAAGGPVWIDPPTHEESSRDLASAYRSAMRLANEHRCRSIAFPAISTGIYGFPLGPATAIAVRTVREELANGSTVEEVIFSCFDERTLEAYREAGVEVR